MSFIENYQPFLGQHCETTTAGNLLNHAGLKLSEPMLFGLGEGLAYGVFVFKNAPAPFIGGRTRPESITDALAKNLGFKVDYRKTRSTKKAWHNVSEFIDAGQPVGVKLDMFYLDYAQSDVHFAGHYLTVHGYDDHVVHVIDTIQQGEGLTTARDHFEQARLWKGPMASNALTWTVSSVSADIDWPVVIERAIVANAQAYLDPPITNFGAKGIAKTAKLIPTWLDTVENAGFALAQLGMLMEEAGTGGGLFRVMYRNFLTEANTYLERAEVTEAKELYAIAAPLWTEVASLLAVAGDRGRPALEEAALVLLELADLEERAATILASL